MKKLFLISIALLLNSCSDYYFEKDLRDAVQSLRDLPYEDRVVDFSNFTSESDWSYLLILQTDESVPLEAYNEFGEMNNYFGFNIEDMSTNQMRFYLLSLSKKPIETFQIDKYPKNSEHLIFESCTDTLRYGIIYKRSESTFNVSFNSSDAGKGTAFLEPNC
ncbi:MAG: hypothetical protein ABJV04_07280 [Aliiglaciecola sp.]|uniref:hypothetical protein n=1 Tax=Aliiglaciecola sp. TaxID=1872441 RepID=UPI0032997F2D